MTENNNESTDSRNEKRFTLAYSDDSEKSKWWAVRDEDITLWKEEVVYLLNQLHEENEQLKKDTQDLKTGTYINAKNHIAELQKEIEHLREYNNKLLKKPLLTDILPNASEIMAANTELEKENDKLKSDRVRFEEETRLEVTRVMDKIFELIDKKIEFYKHKPVSAPISNPANPNYDDDVDRLARLSELVDLKETLKKELQE